MVNYFKIILIIYVVIVDKKKKLVYNHIKDVNFMDRRLLVEFVVASILIFIGAFITLLPIFSVVSVRMVFIAVIALYGVIHLIKNLLILNAKDYTGFSTSLSSTIDSPSIFESPNVVIGLACKRNRLPFSKAHSVSIGSP